MGGDHKENSTSSSKRNGGEDSDLSRRSIVVTIGQAVIGLGLSGRVFADAQAPAPLPPGLYQPSNDHLSHALMSSGPFHAIPPGCPTDYIRPRTEPFTPLFFSPADFELVCRMTQLLLGDLTAAVIKDETAAPAKEVAEWVDLSLSRAEGNREMARHLDPLHRVLAVAYYGLPHVNQLETATPEKTCSEGFEWLSQAARFRGSNRFLNLTEEQQIAILDSISDERPDNQNENAGTRFFTFMKTEVIRGYYTSQAGLKELDFKGNAFYARSPGCDSKPRYE
jgi:hypothetical protein